MSKDETEFSPDKPESLPRLHVPGLTEDAASLPPEALAGQVPVLTEQVEVDETSSTVFSSDHQAAPARLSAMAPVAPNRFAAAAPSSALAPVAPNRFAAGVSDESAVADLQEVPSPAAEVEPEPSEAPQDDALAPVEAVAQEPAPQADTRSKQIQARMGQLSEKIHALHDRLNRLEKPEV